jgi:hypothetical protein
MFPHRFPGRLGNVASFLLGGEGLRVFAHFRLIKRVIPIIEIAAKENHWIA